MKVGLIGESVTMHYLDYYCEKHKDRIAGFSDVRDDKKYQEECKYRNRKAAGCSAPYILRWFSEFSVLNTIYSVYSVDGLPHLWYNAYALGR